MSAPYFFELIGHVFVAAQSAHTHKELSKVLSPSGFGDAQVKEGLALVKEGETLLHTMLGSIMPDNKSLEHNIHAAVMEVEMWLQSVKLKCKKAGFNASVCKVVVGHDLHAHDHTITGVAQALRAIGYLRSLDAEQVESLGGKDRVHDLVMRGNTLVKKLYKVADSLVMPSSMVPRSNPIFKQFDALNLKLSMWLDRLMGHVKKVNNLKVLGVIGHVPDDRGIPVGGAAFNVTLHERAIQAPPSPAEADRTSGWSVGRQGNKENQERGWTPPDYGSVTGD